MGPVTATVAKLMLRGGFREVRVVTEWRDGCVWKTKCVGFIVVDNDRDPPLKRGTAVLCAPSTDYSMALLQSLPKR